MIHLYQLYPDMNTPDPSPFCFKVHFFMKYYKIDFKPHKANLLKAPKKKAPYIFDDTASVTISDSEDIIKYLCERFHLSPDKDLEPQQKPQSFALRKTLEEYLYFVILYSRWGDQNGWNNIEPIYFKDIPKPIRFLITPLIRKSVIKSMYGQGMGRHSQTEIYQRGIELLAQLSTWLADGDFFMGKNISLVDFTAFPMLYEILKFPYQSPLFQPMQQHTNLVSYVEKISSQFYPNPSFPTP